MTRKEKRLQGFLARTKGYEWKDLVALMQDFGFELRSAGKGFKFIHLETGTVIIAHRPHPETTVKLCYLDQIRDKLVEMKLLEIQDD